MSRKPLTSLGALFEPIVSSANTVARIFTREKDGAGLHQFFAECKKFCIKKEKLQEGQTPEGLKTTLFDIWCKTS